MSQSAWGLSKSLHRVFSWREGEETDGASQQGSSSLGSWRIAAPSDPLCGAEETRCPRPPFLFFFSPPNLMWVSLNTFGTRTLAAVQRTTSCHASLRPSIFRQFKKKKKKYILTTQTSQMLKWFRSSVESEAATVRTLSSTSRFSWLRRPDVLHPVPVIDWRFCRNSTTNNIMNNNIYNINNNNNNNNNNKT